MNMIRLVGLVLGFWLVGSSAHALEPINKTLFGGLAVKGYDPEAYFQAGKPVKGSKEFSYIWQGATWLFATAQHRDQFVAAPDRFAPQYGGYCAWAVSQGYTADIDPEAWKIVEGRLFLNYSPKIQARWQADLTNLVNAADHHWPDLLKK